jgi:AraC-binding-like domain
MTMEYAAPTLQRLCADDVDSATDVLTQAYSDVSVCLHRASRDLRVEVASCKLANVTLGALSISRSTVSTACYPYVAVCLPISGKIQITSNRLRAAVGGQSGAVVSSGSPAVVEYHTDDCRMESLLFERTAVEAELAAMPTNGCHWRGESTKRWRWLRGLVWRSPKASPNGPNATPMTRLSSPSASTRTRQRRKPWSALQAWPTTPKVTVKPPGSSVPQTHCAAASARFFSGFTTAPTTPRLPQFVTP